MKLRVTILGILLIILVAGFGKEAVAAGAGAPLIGESEIMRSEDIRPGMRGYGLTVFKGTTRERFNLTVIGVLKNYDMGSDLILARITSGPVVTRDWGVIAGMSGSPIYINGKLVGALGYGWAFSKEPIAGITPISQMVENVSPGTLPWRRASFGGGQDAGATKMVSQYGPVQVGDKQIERFEILQRGAQPGRANAETMTLAPIATPVMVSGLSPRAIEALKKLWEPLGLVPMAGGGKSPVRLTGAPVPGDSIGILLAGGDIDLTVVGTVTYVKNGVVLAMGHPFNTSGEIDLPMVKSYVFGVLPSLNFSSKIASGSDEIIGRWTHDRMWVVGGKLGETAKTFPMEFSVWNRDDNLRKEFTSIVCQDRLFSGTIAGLVIDSAIDSVAPSREGSLQSEVTVKAKGLPPLVRKGFYSQSNESGWGSYFSFFFGSGTPGWEVSSIVDNLFSNPYGPVEPVEVTLQAEWTKERLAGDIEEVRARKHTVRPGETIELEVAIRRWKAPDEKRTIEVKVPENAPPGPLHVGVAGGYSVEEIEGQLEISDPVATNFAQQWANYARYEKYNDLIVETALETVGVELRGRQMFDVPKIVAEVVQHSGLAQSGVIRNHERTVTEVPYLLSGAKVLSFMVETDEKEKAGRGPSVGRRGGRMGMMGGPDEDMGDGEFEMRGRVRPWGAGEAPDLEDIFGEEGEAPPEMPSWEEMSELEGKDPEEISAGKDGRGGKSKGGLRGPGIWKDTVEKDFSKGKTEGTLINSTGQVELSATGEVAYESAEGILWSAAADAAGNVYTGSWIEAKVYKIAPDGTSSAVLEADDAMVLALAVDAADNVYAATAPSGAIHKITPQGETSVFCKLEDEYVWALTTEEPGLLAATGPRGKIYRISETGVAREIFAAPDRHVIALAKASGNVFYAATYPKGKVYRISGDAVENFYETVGGVTALSLAVDAEDNLYIGTSPKGRIIAIDPTGRARMLYASKERHIFALEVAADGRIYAATGPKAKIYRISQEGDWGVVWDGKRGYVLAVAESRGRLLAVLPETRQLLDLNMGEGTEGNFVSQVHDTSGPSKWGQIRWQAEVPEKTSLWLQTRSGNTAYPDGTWSEWSRRYVQATGEKIESPPGRYIQYKTTLKSGNAARPVLRHVEVFYMQENRAPEVTITAPVQGPVWSGEKKIKWKATDPNKDTLTYKVYYSADAGGSWTEIKEEDKKKKGDDKEKKAEENGEKGDNPGNNANGENKAADEEANGNNAAAADEQPDDKKPDRAKKPSKATSLDWDTKSVEDGVYLIKVVASDEQSNPKDELTDEKVSEPLRVDNTPPLIVLDKTKELAPPPAKVEIAEGGTYVAIAEYRVDEGEWKPALCEDGIYDGLAETALIDTEELPAGEHKLEIRAKDGVGNEATNDVKYNKPGEGNG